MTTRQLILSNNTSYRLLRHVLALWLYAFLFHISNNNRTLLYLACYLPACILSAYVFSYLLLPFLKLKKYIGFAVGFAVIFIITLLINYYTSLVFFANWGGNPFAPNMVLGLAFFNQTNALCIGGIAMGMKATKNWYILQKENQIRERQKAINELKLEKANLYPEFILQTLNNIHTKIEVGAVESPSLIMKMSDILGYMLYESQNDFIALERELNMVKDFVDLRKMNWPVTFIRLSITGHQENKYIVPLTMFRLLQNLFQTIDHQAKALEEVLIKINIKNESLFFRLTGIYSDEPSDLENWKRTVTAMRCQLEGIYHEVVDLEVEEDEYVYSISLKVVLAITPSVEAIVNQREHKENVLA
jgi:two-component system LytT family sensor kinase